MRLNSNFSGVLSPPIDELTVQGYDLQFGINVLGMLSSSKHATVLHKIFFSGHVHFTKQLLPALISGAKSSSDGKARVVTLSSVGAYFSPSLDLDLAGDTDKRKKTSPMTLYVHSKLVWIHSCLYIAFFSLKVHDYREIFFSLTN